MPTPNTSNFGGQRTVLTAASATEATEAEETATAVIVLSASSVLAVGVRGAAIVVDDAAGASVIASASSELNSAPSIVRLPRPPAEQHRRNGLREDLHVVE